VPGRHACEGATAEAGEVAGRAISGSFWGHVCEVGCEQINVWDALGDAFSEMTELPSRLDAIGGTAWKWASCVTGLSAAGPDRATSELVGGIVGPAEEAF
jgi:hypothetical protein